jgi:hypothetical protein
VDEIAEAPAAKPVCSEVIAAVLQALHLKEARNGSWGLANDYMSVDFGASCIFRTAFLWFSLDILASKNFP